MKEKRRWANHTPPKATAPAPARVETCARCRQPFGGRGDPPAKCIGEARGRRRYVHDPECPPAYVREAKLRGWL